MKIAAEELTQLANELCANETVAIDEMKYKFLARSEAMLSKDIADNRAIGEYGASAILDGITGNVRVLTHCNTGSLATAGYGTALGVVRRLQDLGRLEHVFCTETRPYNQGARLTAFELVHDKLPATLIVDSMVAALMRHKVSTFHFRPAKLQISYLLIASHFAEHRRCGGRSRSCGRQRRHSQQNRHISNCRRVQASQCAILHCGSAHIDRFEETHRRPNCDRRATGP